MLLCYVLRVSHFPAKAGVGWARGAIGVEDGVPAHRLGGGVPGYGAEIEVKYKDRVYKRVIALHLGKGIG